VYKHVIITWIKALTFQVIYNIICSRGTVFGKATTFAKLTDTSRSFLFECPAKTTKTIERGFFKMKKQIFKGAATALITPMKDGKIDFDKYALLIEDQIKNSIDALVVCGTTGESATLNDTEHRELIEYTVKQVNKRVPVIAGTGSNDTNYAIGLSTHACEMGVDGLLLVTPYYNKTTQRGIVKHFNAIADRVTVPMIVYNVPSRTGLNILPETYKELSYHENIVAAKEANGNISAVAETIHLCGDNLAVISGDDDQTVPIMALGGTGVISVLSNLLPYETHMICKYMLDGDVASAAREQLKYIPLIKALFCETNPIPAKAAMEALGFCTGELRLPLAEISDANREKLFAEMRNVGIKF